MGSPSLELQGAIVALLKGAPAVMTLIHDVYNRVPKDPWGPQQGYISLGNESVITDDGGCVEMQNIEIEINVWSRRVGDPHCKEIVHEVRRAMRSLALAENPIVAVVGPYQDIRLDPDGLTTRGILRYEFEVEVYG